MNETLFPVRTRCKKCRRKLDSIVLNGIFCSYRCAEHPQPKQKILEAPRHCKREVNKQWDWKSKYRYEGEVPQKLRDDPATNIYRCDYCLFLHVGHSRLKPEDQQKLRRVIHDHTTLGSVIHRRRLQLDWDKKQLAKDLKIPALRITEIESGNPNMDVVALFKVLSRLKLSVEIIER